MGNKHSAHKWNQPASPSSPQTPERPAVRRKSHLRPAPAPGAVPFPALVGGAIPQVDQAAVGSVDKTKGPYIPFVPKKKVSEAFESVKPASPGKVVIPAQKLPEKQGADHSAPGSAHDSVHGSAYGSVHGSIYGSGLASAEEDNGDDTHQPVPKKMANPMLQRAKSALPHAQASFDKKALFGRSKSMPVSVHRRADINLDEDTIAETARLQAKFKKVLQKQRSKSLLDSEIDDMIKDCENYVYGALKLNGVPGEERGIIGQLPSYVSVGCFKGLKGVADSSANQDNYSYCKYKDYEFFTVQDGHGPGGHFVSFRGVRTLPLFVAHSEHFPHNMTEALIQGYAQCNEDVVRHCVDNAHDIQISGAACIMAVRKDKTLWLSHTGDSRIVVGTTGPSSASGLVVETVDHKPTNPEERNRLEASGSEIQTYNFENDMQISRVYVKGTEYPGLCMSRSIGDQSVKPHGVIPLPDVKQLETVTGKFFCVLATDGVWEFVPSKLVCSSLSKKLATEGREKCVARIVTESKKRWKTHEGTYCDDITAMIISL